MLNKGFSLIRNRFHSCLRCVITRAVLTHMTAKEIESLRNCQSHVLSGWWWWWYFVMRVFLMETKSKLTSVKIILLGILSPLRDTVIFRYFIHKGQVRVGGSGNDGQWRTLAGSEKSFARTFVSLGQKMRFSVPLTKKKSQKIGIYVTHSK